MRALGPALEDRPWPPGRPFGLNPSTLTRFRARLLLHGKERLALESSLALAEELGLVDAPAEQIVDSTPMLGAAATQDTVRLVRCGVKKLIDAVAATDEDAARSLEDGLCFDYARPAEKPDCRWREKAERERMLTRVAEAAERALQAVEQGNGLLAEDAVKEAHSLLRELIGQDSTSTPTACPGCTAAPARTGFSPPSTPRCATGASRSPSASTATSCTPRPPTQTSPCPPPSRWRRLTSRTAPRRGPARPTARRAPPRAAARGHRIRERTGAGGASRARGRSAGPGARGGAPRGVDKRDFAIDLGAGTVTCPAGQLARIRTEPSGRRRARFARRSCDRCLLRDRCVSPVRGDRQVVLAPDEALLIAARQALDHRATSEHLRRTRPRIERLLGLLVHRYGARKARYIGTAKARLQALWTAALVNLNPIGRLLTTQAA